MIFCSLYSGSSGNSILVGNDSTKVLIDAGMPGKKIDEALAKIDQNPKEIDGIFVTHEHSDHVKGVGVLSRKYDIPVYANSDTWEAMSKTVGKIKEKNIKIMDKRSTVEINDLSIKSFIIPHDASGPVGYTIKSKDKTASIATDFGTFTEEIKDNIKESDIILLESNHDVSMLKFGPYPYNLKRRILSEIGHLSNDDCAKAILELVKYGREKHVILGHLSGTNNHPDLAYQTVINILEEKGIKLGEDINIKMASRHEPSSLINL